MPRTTPKQCPECGHRDLDARRDPGRFALGWLLIAVGTLTALPTLGITLFLVILGVSWTAPRLRCPECGWRGPAA
jgi:DNA-directed RNA polymerase subunit RPC12/RpoP